MSSRRIDLVAPPFRGHLYPILGLARALREVADVRVLTTRDRMEEVAASGVEGVPLLQGREAAVAALADPPRRVRAHPLRLWRQFQAALSELDSVRLEMISLWQAAPPDLVIVDSVLPSVGYAARGLGVRWWTSLASPCALEPLEGTPSYLGGWKHREDWLGRWRDRGGLALIRVFKRAVFRLHRRRLRAWGVAGPYHPDGSESAYSPECIVGLGMSELELPRRWPSAFTFIGPSLYTPPQPRAATPELEPGRPHILVTLGTHLAAEKQELRPRLQAMAEREKRWVVHFSHGDPAAAVSNRNGSERSWFREHAFVSYDAWLSRFDLVLHHGGAGVMYACVREARPALVWPLDYDQFDHAVRIERAGIGRRVHRLDDLPRVIDAVLADTALHARCRDLQARFRSYDAGAAVRARVRRTLLQSD